MFLNFKTLTLQNFMSHENSTINLNRGGFTLLQGKNDCPEDSAHSNGSGKSALWDGLSWCLTGETLRGGKDIERKGCKEGTLVKLEFDVDSSSYILIRTKNHSTYKTNLKIFVNGEDVSGKGIRDSEEILQKLLPDLTSSLLGSVIVLGQGMPNKFSDNTPAGRKAVLENLSKSDFMIEQLKEKVGDRSFYLSTNLREQENEGIKSNTKLNLLKERLTQIQNQQTDLSTIDLTELKNKQAALSVELSSIEAEGRDAELANQALDERIDAVQSELLNVTSAQNQALSTITDPYNSQLTDLQAQKVELTAEINSLEKEISRLESITDICPTCGQKIQGIEKPSTLDQRTTLAKLLDQRNCIMDSYAKLNDECSTQVKLTEESFLANKHQFEVELNDLKSKKVQGQRAVAELNRQYISKSQELNKLTLYIERTESDIERLTSESLSVADETSKIELDIEAITSQIQNIESHLQVLQKMETFLKRDFRGILLTNIIDFINKKAGDYSDKVFGHRNLSVEQEGNNIQIRFLSKEYSTLSGGEQKKVDIIIQLALRQMLRTYLNFSSNLFVTDEIFDALDIQGCQKILTLLTQELADVGTIFIVTHRADLRISTDDLVVVHKGPDGISRIRTNN